MASNTYFQDGRESTGLLAELGREMSSLARSLNDPVARAARRFRSKRANYYETLADRLENASGLTLKSLFDRDAQRYSEDADGKAIKTPQGILAAHWAQRYLDTGGNLAATFDGTLPPEDIALIRASELAGGGALPSTLRDMARLTAMVATAKQTFIATTAVGIFAALVLAAALLSLPWFIAPLLRETFGAIPVDQMPTRALRLFAFSDAVQSNALVLLASFGVGIWWVKWSLFNLTGDWRRRLDKFGIWRLYRDFQGAMFLAVLSTLVKQRNNAATQLPDALTQLREGSSKWLSWHIDQMLDNLSSVSSMAAIENSTAIAMALNTGLIDQETFWYFLDVQDGAGIAQGLQKTGQRVEGPTLKKVAARAMALRYVLIIMALGGVLAIGGTTAATTSALTTAMKNYYLSS
jgi:hypothetical protein